MTSATRAELMTELWALRSCLADVQTRLSGPDKLFVGLRVQFATDYLTEAINHLNHAITTESDSRHPSSAQPSPPKSGTAPF